MESFKKEIKKCPGCGSEKRFYEGIIKELQENGLLDEKVTQFEHQIRQGSALSQEKIALLPMGAEVPSFQEVWDICEDCGTYYAVRLIKGNAKKAPAPPQLHLPNRADRRRLEKDSFNIRN